MARTQQGEGLGLRERKKFRTRQLIQSHALRLFHEQGYKETSVEEIAEAAEVSPSTVFHYFPTKADLVIYDSMDELLVEALRAVPADVGLLEAMRQAIRQTFSSAHQADMDTQVERERLMRTVPELRAAMLEEFTRTMHVLSELLAERSGRPANDEKLEALAGAVIGIGLSAWLRGDGEVMTQSFLERIDRGMAWLASGFNL
ncbi:MAG: TetR family transcriptional regulator [Thermaerobacter sp.]|nr:TetR family transcriptional regulator [Thermaerobacter sp.]